MAVQIGADAAHRVEAHRKLDGSGVVITRAIQRALMSVPAKLGKKNYGFNYLSQ